MAISYRASTFTALNNDTSKAATKPTGTVNGDGLVAFIGVGPDSGLISGMTVTPPSGWTLVGRVDGSNNNAMAVYKKSASGEGASWTWGFSVGVYGAILIVAASGADVSTIVEASVTEDMTDDASSTSQDIAAITTLTNNALVLAAIFGNTLTAASTSTPPGSTTEFIDSHPITTRRHFTAAYFTQASAGSTGAQTFTLTENGNSYVGAMVAVKEVVTVSASGAVATITVAGKSGTAITLVSAAGALAAVDVAGKNGTAGLTALGTLATVDVDGLSGVISSGAEGQAQACKVTVVGLGGTYGLGTLGGVATVAAEGLAGAASFVVSAAGALATIAVQAFAGIAIRAGGSGRYRPGAGRFVSPGSPSGTFNSMKNGVGRFFGPRGGMGR